MLIKSTTNGKLYNIRLAEIDAKLGTRVTDILEELDDNFVADHAVDEATNAYLASQEEIDSMISFWRSEAAAWDRCDPECYLGDPADFFLADIVEDARENGSTLPLYYAVFVDEIE